MPTVLIAEDDELIRVLAESILQDDGYQTLTAANATEALAILQAGEPIDLLFTDIHMGTESGIDLAIATRELRPDIEVLYTTAAGVTDGTRAQFVDRSKFLPKAYRMEDLLEAVVLLIGK